LNSFAALLNPIATILCRDRGRGCRNLDHLGALFAGGFACVQRSWRFYTNVGCVCKRLRPGYVKGGIHQIMITRGHTAFGCLFLCLSLSWLLPDVSFGRDTRELLLDGYASQRGGFGARVFVENRGSERGVAR
ncbi:unnamed protein product, partial [Ectocarpus sp. 13 AM-2016]